jgi:hypothetical protein
VRELPHLYGFDFDLFRCTQCGRLWVNAWLNASGWHEVTPEDAATMLALDEAELRVFMREWARPFD